MPTAPQIDDPQMLSRVISSRSHHSFRDQHKGVLMRKTPFISTSARGLLGFPTSKAQHCSRARPNCSKGNMGSRNARQAEVLICGAVRLRGHWGRRQGTRCGGYCEATLSAPWTAPCPRRATAIHMRSRRRGMRAECARIALIVAWIARTVFYAWLPYRELVWTRRRNILYFFIAFKI